MQRKNREITIFSLSAIDLFCSGMGAVMVLMVLLMPYYTKKDATEPDVEDKPTQILVVKPPPVPEPVPEPEPKPEPKPEKPGLNTRGIDVVFVLDTTASMTKEHEAVRNNLTSIVQVLRRLTDDIRVGFVGFNDRGSPYRLELLPVNKDEIGNSNLGRLLDEIERVEISGGGDWPEDVCDGLEQAAAMAWPPDSEERRQVIILLGDARTHPEDHDRSMSVASRWVGASPNRAIEAVHTGGMSPGDSPGLVAEIMAAQQYFKQLAEAGKGRYFEGQKDVLGSILDILIIK